MGINYSEVYIFNDQPTTCPKCGSMTDITLDLFQTKDKIQINKCLNMNCRYEFIMKFDIDFDNGALL